MPHTCVDFSDHVAAQFVKTISRRRTWRRIRAMRMTSLHGWRTVKRKNEKGGETAMAGRAEKTEK